MPKPKCDICGREFKTQNALGSHVSFVHGGMVKGVPSPSVEDAEISKATKAVKLAELSGALKRAQAAAVHGDHQLLYAEVDRQGRENTALKSEVKDQRAFFLAALKDRDIKISSLVSSTGILPSLSSDHSALVGQFRELSKIVAFQLTSEGWTISTDPWGNPSLNGLADKFLDYLVREGKLKRVGS